MKSNMIRYKGYSARPEYSPELHRKISAPAQSESVSLNKAVEQAIAAFV